MKKVLLVFVTVLICSLSFSQGISFEKGNFSEVLLKAQKEQKLVFVDCYASWCGPCKYLSENIFPEEKLGDYFNKGFVNLKVDMEKGEGLTLKKKYKINAYPTLLFLDAEGNLLNKVVGWKEVDELISEAKKAFELENQLKG